MLLLDMSLKCKSMFVKIGHKYKLMKAERKDSDLNSSYIDSRSAEAAKKG